jgi:hypothetical protein
MFNRRREVINGDVEATMKPLGATPGERRGEGSGHEHGIRQGEPFKEAFPSEGEVRHELAKGSANVLVCMTVFLCEPRRREDMLPTVRLTVLGECVGSNGVAVRSALPPVVDLCGVEADGPIIL